MRLLEGNGVSDTRSSPQPRTPDARISQIASVELRSKEGRTPQ